MVVGETIQFDQVEHVANTRGTPPAIPTCELEREGDVLRNRAPVVEDGILEDDAVVAVDARASRGLAVDDDVARGGLDQVAHDPQKRGFATTGRTDERNELARLDRQLDALESVRSPGECLRDAADIDDAH